MKTIQYILITLFLLGSFALMNGAPPPDGAGNQTPATTKASVELTGTVVRRDGKYCLTDAKSQRTVQLRGKQFAGYVGKTVTVHGEAVQQATLACGGREAILWSKNGVSTATGLAAGTATAAATSTGVSGLALGAAGAAAAAAGTVGGLYASGTIGGDQPASHP